MSDGLFTGDPLASCRLARSRWLLTRSCAPLSCDIRAKSGRREAIEPFEITDEMTIIAHSDVVDDFLDRKVRRLRELFGFFHPALFQVLAWRLTCLGPEKTATVRWREIHRSSQFLERQWTRKLLLYERRYLLNAAVHMSRLCGFKGALEAIVTRASRPNLRGASSIVPAL